MEFFQHEYCEMETKELRVRSWALVAILLFLIFETDAKNEILFDANFIGHGGFSMVLSLFGASVWA
jgi:hypothetical protein